MSDREERIEIVEEQKHQLDKLIDLLDGLDVTKNTVKSISVQVQDINCYTQTVSFVGDNLNTYLVFHHLSELARTRSEQLELKLKELRRISDADKDKEIK